MKRFFALGLVFITAACGMPHSLDQLDYESLQRDVTKKEIVRQLENPYHRLYVVLNINPLNPVARDAIDECAPYYWEMKLSEKKYPLQDVTDAELLRWNKIVERCRGYARVAELVAQSDMQRN